MIKKSRRGGRGAPPEDGGSVKWWSYCFYVLTVGVALKVMYFINGISL